ncbi:Metallo-peptidase family M12B Reprolysin-like-domain-containing protein [Hyaloraphidium curvatum]|nr:Metallo-peptidase family M12B Reprolysin-like-domain-containing protein [Hyaloraphidium curvatum]
MPARRFAGSAAIRPGARSFSFRASALAVLLPALLLAGNARAAGPPSLFSDLPPMDALPDARPDRFAARERRVGANPSLLAAGGPERIALPLFNDATFSAVRSQVVESDEMTTWFGDLDVNGTGYVSLTASPAGDIVGTIITASGTFKILPEAPGVHRIKQVNLTAKPSFAHPERPPASNRTGGEPRLSRRQALPGPDGIYTVDVLGLYTPASARAWGAANPRLIYEHDIELANDAFRNSLVNIRFRLVHVAQVNYDWDDFRYALDDLTGTNDGYMDSVHALRNEYGADLVHLYINDDAYCGKGWILTDPGSASNDDYGFAVSSAECIADFTLAHECGHNMGCDHDQANAGGAPGAFAYSYGYQHVEGQFSFRTIMAYDCDLVNCPTVAHWSNPNVNYNNRATGRAGADNARSLNNVAAEIAGFRAQVVGLASQSTRTRSQTSTRSRTATKSRTASASRTLTAKTSPGAASSTAPRTSTFRASTTAAPPSPTATTPPVGCAPVTVFSTTTIQLPAVTSTETLQLPPVVSTVTVQQTVEVTTTVQVGSATTTIYKTTTKTVAKSTTTRTRTATRVKVVTKTVRVR